MDARVQKDESRSQSAQGRGLYAAGGIIRRLLGYLSHHAMLTVRMQANKRQQS